MCLKYRLKIKYITFESKKGLREKYSNQFINAHLLQI